MPLFDDILLRLAPFTPPPAVGIPIGVVLPFGGSSAPAEWLLCDGSAVSRTTYAALFAVIGETFGPGDGSTTFNVPDLRDRVPAGVGNPLHDVSVSLADQAGEETHTLLTAEMPSHRHNMYGAASSHPSVNSGGSSSYVYPSGSSGSAGGDAAHNNLQPYLSTPYIIYAGA